MRGAQQREEELLNRKPYSIQAGRPGLDGANPRHFPLERLGGARRLGFARGPAIPPEGNERSESGRAEFV